jgi:hypothetical protein
LAHGILIGSGLTRKQRSLIIVLICFLIYISFCSIVNVYLVADNRDFLEALYFTLVTIQTIGFGDIVPHDSGGRIWTCCFATVGEHVRAGSIQGPAYGTPGILFLGMLVGMISDTVLEFLQAGYNRRIAEVRLRRRELQKRRKQKYRWRKAVEARLRAKGAPIWIGPHGQTASHSAPTSTLGSMYAALSGRNMAGAGRGSARVPLKLNVGALSPAELSDARREAEMPARSKSDEGDERGRTLDRGGRPTPERSDSADSANMNFSRSFDEYKDTVESEKRKQFWGRVRGTSSRRNLRLTRLRAVLGNVDRIPSLLARRIPYLHEDGRLVVRRQHVLLWVGPSSLLGCRNGSPSLPGYITFSTIGFGMSHLLTNPAMF